MATANRVGGEVDALCNRCKLTLAHTILAMVGEKIARVQCNTCGGDHMYRGASASSSTPKAPRASTSASGARASGSAAAPAKVTISFEQRLAGRDLAGVRRYSPKDTYVLDEVLEHPNFGYGIVSAVRSDKIDVAFKIFEKTLIHGRGGGAPAAKPMFARPTGGRTGPSDKPLAEEESNGDEAASESEPIGG